MKKNTLIIVVIICVFLLGVLFSFEPSFSSTDFAVKTNQCGSNKVYLPLISNRWMRPFSGVREDEINASNNSKAQALTNGYLISGETYFGKANDSIDFYALYAPSGGTFHIEVINHDVDGGQVLLYHSSDPAFIKRSTTPPDHEIVASSILEDVFFVLIFTDQNKRYNPDVDYELTVTYSNPNLTTVTPFPTICPPTQTPTVTPSHTPTATATATATPTATPPPTFCNPSESGIQVNFKKEVIVADGNLDDADTMDIPVSIPMGKYNIYLGSYDNHEDPENGDQTQEIWFLRLKNHSGSVLYTTKETPTNDIPPGLDCQETIISAFVINLPISFISARHAMFPGDEPNSVRPDYAVFERIGDAD